MHFSGCFRMWIVDLCCCVSASRRREEHLRRAQRGTSAMGYMGQEEDPTMGHRAQGEEPTVGRPRFSRSRRWCY